MTIEDNPTVVVTRYVKVKTQEIPKGKSEGKEGIVLLRFYWSVSLRPRVIDARLPNPTSDLNF